MALMAFDPEFLDHMESFVTVRRNGGRDKWGNPSYTETSWQCHVDSSQESFGVVGGDGTVLYGRALRTILIGPVLDPVPAPGDQITFSHGSTSVLGKSDTVQVVNDEDGPHHMTITLTNA